MVNLSNQRPVALIRLEQTLWPIEASFLRGFRDMLIGNFSPRRKEKKQQQQKTATEKDVYSLL
jgi:hypothetical protein